jgi:PST family polysaccharide transporter
MIGRPASEMVSLIAAAVLARLVIPAEFGRYTVALVVLGLANVPTQAVNYSLVQRDHLEPDHLRTGITLTIILGVAICALTFAASYWIVTPVFGARTADLVRLMIPACFLNSVNTVPLAMISRRLQFRRLSIIDFTISLVGSVTAIALAADGMNGAGMVLGTTAGSLAGLVLICVWAPPCLPNFRVRAASDLMRFGVPAASAAASVVCFQNCDYMLIGARLGALQTGFYFRAYTLSVQYQTKASQVLTSVGFPVLSRASSAEEIDDLRERMIRTITLLVLPLLVILAIVAPRFVPWFYGPAWGPAVFPVQVLTIGGAASSRGDVVRVGAFRRLRNCRIRSHAIRDRRSGNRSGDRPHGFPAHRLRAAGAGLAARGNENILRGSPAGDGFMRRPRRCRDSRQRRAVPCARCDVPVSRRCFPCGRGRLPRHPA